MYQLRPPDSEKDVHHTEYDVSITNELKLYAVIFTGTVVSFAAVFDYV